MAKTKRKPPKTKEITNTQLIKYYTKNTAEAVINELNNTTIDELLTDVYLNNISSELKKFVKHYEQQLYLAIEKKDYFVNNLHDFFKAMSFTIQKENLYNSFFKFVIYVYEQLAGKKSHIFNAYENLLTQQYCYLSGIGKNIYGISCKGKPFITGEAIPGLDELLKKIVFIKNPADIPTLKNINSILRHSDYQITSYADLDRLALTERSIVNNYYHTAFLIDDDNIDMASLNNINPSDKIIFDDNLTNISNQETIDMLLNSLVDRIHFLPNKRTICKIKNNDKIETIEFYEKIVDDNIFTLFKIKYYGGKSTTGFIDITKKFIHTMWAYSNYEESMHYPMSVIILSIYRYLICETNNIPQYIQDIVINFIENLYIVDNKKPIKSETDSFKKLSVNEYKVELKLINPYIRKLPLNAKASQEALDKAKKLGIQLPDGYTFVEAFSRKTKVIKQ